MYAFAVMIGSPIVGKALTIYGRKIILLLGVGLMGFSMIGFGMISHLKNKVWIVSTVITLRTFQGLCSGLILTTSYAIIAITFPNEQQRYLGIVEAAVGFGCVIGPITGSFLYTLFGFDGTFYLVGSLFII